jgi:5-methylcytosine-specific restriction enzyme subunit McrC
MTRRLELDELDRVGRVVALNDAQVQALQATRLVDVTLEPRGRWRLLPNGRVGAVAVDDLEVLVCPKAAISSLLFMLGYAADPGFRTSEIAGLATDDLWGAIAETLARLGERAVAAGVLQGYVTVDDALPLIRGRWRVADQIARRSGMPLPAEVRFDEFSPDIAENRILRTAVRRLLRLPRVPVGARRRLGHLDGRLDGVRVLAPGAPLPEWTPSRLNGRYHAALRLAETVLAWRAPQIDAGATPLASFVVAMAKVFEDFVTVALREALAGYPGQTRGQYPTRLDRGRLVPMRPDVVHVRHGHPVAVFDAKYKLEGSSGRYPNADAYQMLAYCTALGLREGWLVYAQGSHGVRRIEVRNTEVTIVEYPLDLATRPSGLIVQVEALAFAALDSDPRAIAS